MGALLFFGAAAYVAHRLVRGDRARTLLMVAAAVAVLLVGFGRVHTGAHWPSDVLGGYLWGALVLFALVDVFATFRRPRDRPVATTQREPT